MTFFTATLPHHNLREHSMIRGAGPYRTLITPKAGSLFPRCFPRDLGRLNDRNPTLAIGRRRPGLALVGADPGRAAAAPKQTCAASPDQVEMIALGPPVSNPSGIPGDQRGTFFADHDRRCMRTRIERCRHD